MTRPSILRATTWLAKAQSTALTFAEGCIAPLEDALRCLDVSQLVLVLHEHRSHL